MTVHVVSFRDKIPSGAAVVNTTSRSDNWSNALSPFFLGPLDLYGGHKAQNVENAWQFSKVYPSHIGKDGEPTELYWEWAKKGWADTYAHRYPMGKGAVPKYSLWDGKKYGYIEARRNIYVPCYARAVYSTTSFKKLVELSQQEADVYLQDFDGYNYKSLNMSLSQVIDCSTRKMGHAFVLAMLLENYHNVIDQLNLDY